MEDGSDVKAGDVLARIPTEGAKTRDITGGLPRVAELFEARKPKEAAVLAETDGFVEFGKDYKNKRRVIVKPKNEKLEPTEYLIPKGKHISVREGDYVEKGDYIVEGNPSPHDILRIKGMEELATYLVKEIQDVYRLQGVKINDKHIEVICRQMMQKLEITDGGDTTLLAGEQVDQLELDEANKKAAEDGRQARRRPRRPAGHHQGVACRRARCSRRPRSRRPRASSPMPPSTARSTRWKASRRTSSSAVSSRRAPAAPSRACATSRPNATRRSRRNRRRSSRWPSWKHRSRARERAWPRVGADFAKPRSNQGRPRGRPFSFAGCFLPTSNG